jgi:simple sugar transport system substrate-binding protein
MGTYRYRSVLGAIASVVALLIAAPDPAQAQQDKWCSNVKLRFFAGGAEGDTFALTVYRGAQQAARDLGANVEYVFSAWDRERMVQQFREAVASRPDGIAMMGHPGPNALGPIAEEAKNVGVRVMYQNVDVPELRAKFGGGYIGAALYEQGMALGNEAQKRFNLKAGDKVIVFANWASEARVRRELGVAKALEEAGMKVIRIQVDVPMFRDPNLLLPTHTAAMVNNPDVKLAAYPGGPILGTVGVYMQAAGKKPGDIKVIGFDNNPQVIDGFDKGWIDLTSDQQPFLQGYLPILSLCQQKVFGFAPLNYDTGSGIIDKTNYKELGDLAKRGIR